MKKQGIWTIFVFLLALVLASLACTVPGFGSDAVEPTPTPVGDTMYFNIPAYTFQLAPGEKVPGTNLQYVDKRGDVYEVLIDGKPASKRVGDSFYWSGVVAPGVFGNFNLRLTATLFGSMPVAGSVELIVLNPNPAERLALPDGADIIKFSNILINYTVPAGYEVPGTTLVFEGIEERGQGGQTTNFARMGGTSGYPYVALGDSLEWTGTLLDNVYLRYNLRVTSLQDDALRLTGTADVWIVPQN
jgi:hypothetical protein